MRGASKALGLSKSAIDRLETMAREEGANQPLLREPGAQYDADSFAAQIDQFQEGTFESGRALRVLSQTPRVLRRVGVPNLPVTITQRVLAKIIGKEDPLHHALPVDMVKQLPAALADPIMVFDSETQPGSLVVMTTLQEAKRPVLAILVPDTTQGRLKVNAIASMYPKSNDRPIVKWIQDGLLRYRHAQKSLDWFQSAGLQLPKEGTNRGGHKIISDADLVKSNLTEKDSLKDNSTNYERRPGTDKAKSDRLATNAVRDLADDASNAMSARRNRAAHMRGDSGIRLHALGITPELVNTQRVDLRAQRASSVHDIASIAQVYRDPRFETLRVVYVEDDQVVATEGISSRLPDATSAFVTTKEQRRFNKEQSAKHGENVSKWPAEAKKHSNKLTREAEERFHYNTRQRMKRLGADGYYLIHNHPSGDATPSSADTRYTKAHGEKIPGLLGHVVIDSGEYAVIELDGTVTKHQIDNDERLHAASVPHEVVGQPAGDAQAIRDVAQRVNQPGGATLVFVTKSRTDPGQTIVRAVETVPAAMLDRHGEFGTFLNNRKAAWGGQHVILYTSSPEVARAGLAFYESGHFRDIVTPSANADEGAWFQSSRRTVMPKTSRVEETAYHGSPHHFDKFTLDHIGSGEGAQTYGWGLYVAGSREVAKFYKEKLGPGRGNRPRDIAARVLRSLMGKPNADELAIKELESRARNVIGGTVHSEQFKQTMAAAIASIRDGSAKGRLYTVDLAPKEDEYLLWDSPLSEQSEKVRTALEGLERKFDLSGSGALAAPTGGQIYGALSAELGKRGASESLLSLGVPGIKYLDQGSRGAGEGSYNYVIFNDADIAIQQVEEERAKYGSERAEPPIALSDDFVARLKREFGIEDPEPHHSEFQSRDDGRFNGPPEYPEGDARGGGEEGAASLNLIAGGAPAFYEQDVKPRLVAFSQGIRGIVNMLSPKTGVDRNVLDKVFKLKGDRDKAIYITQRTLEDARKALDKLRQPEQIAFVDNLKRGGKQATSELQAYSDILRKLDDDTYIEINRSILADRPKALRVLDQVPEALQSGFLRDIQQGVPQSVAKLQPLADKLSPNLLDGLVPYLENHFRVLWKVIPGRPKRGFKGIGKRPLQGSKGMLKRHTLADMSEGIARGGEPYSYNAVNLFENHYADAMKFITARKMWADFKKDGVVAFKKNSDPMPDGFTRLNDSIARVYFPTEKGLVQMGEWVIEENAGRILNNFLSRDLIRESPFGRGLLAIKNATTAVELGLSGFHAVFETGEAIGSGIGLGLLKIYNRGILQRSPRAALSGIRDIAMSPYAPRENVKLGHAVREFLVDPNGFAQTKEGKWLLKRFPDAQQLVDDLFSGGARVAMHEDYKTNGRAAFRAALSAGNFPGALLRSVFAANEWMLHPLFEVYIPRMKLGMWLREYTNDLVTRSKDLASGTVTRGELARENWDFVEDRLGEMNFDNLFWNRTFKTSLQLLFRSVTWKLGNLRATAAAGKGQAGEFARALRERRMPLLHRNMAWLFGMSLFTAALSAIIMKLFTGTEPKEIKDLVFPQIDPEDPEVRISSPTYWKDYLHMWHSPAGYVRSSLSGEIGRVADLWSNKDFYGVEIHHEDDPWVTKRLDDLIHLIPLPFTATNSLRLIEKGEGKKAAMSAAGFGYAPKYVTQTRAEEMLDEFSAATRSEGARTKAEFERSRLVFELARRTRRGEDTKAEIREATQEGRLRPNDEKRINDLAEATPDENRFRDVTIKQALKVWDIATADERARWRPALVEKLPSIENLPVTEREEILARYNRALDRVPGEHQENQLVIQELARLGVKLSYPDRQMQIGNKEQSLPPKQFEAYQQRIHDSQMEQLADMISKPIYQRLSDGDKKAMIEDFKKAWTKNESRHMHGTLVAQSTGASARERMEAKEELIESRIKERDLQNKDLFIRERQIQRRLKPRSEIQIGESPQ